RVPVARCDEEVAGRVDGGTRRRPDRSLPVDGNGEGLLVSLAAGLHRDDTALVVAAVAGQPSKGHVGPAVDDRHCGALLVDAWIRPRGVDVALQPHLAALEAEAEQHVPVATHEGDN